MNRFLSITLIAAALFVSGCATERVYREGPSVVSAPPALTLAQIKEMTAKGVSDETAFIATTTIRGHTGGGTTGIGITIGIAGITVFTTAITDLPAR